VLLTTPRFDSATVAAALGVPDVSFLGSGAFGDTWRVDDHAVKVICVDGYPPVRVAREVAGLSRVRSPHVVQLIDTRTVSLGGKDVPALVFEYVPGGDLQQAIDGGRIPQPEDAQALLVGLLTGVSELHQADGTVHRDIKPANIALRNGAWDQPVLLDLGLARSSMETTVTVYPGLIGTTAYMAPEQLEGRRARKAADLFAVGVSVRAAILGRHPFYDSGSNYTIDEAIAKIAAGPVALPSDTSEPVRETLDRLVRSAEYERGSATSNLRRLGVAK
jgi:serine/threonine protein kinase